MSPRSNRKPALGQRSTSKKHLTSMSCKLERAIWSRDTGQRIPCFDRCQLIITWTSNVMLRDYAVAVAVVRTRPRAITLVMITMRKSTHGFPFVSHMSMGLRLAALRVARAPLLFNFKKACNVLICASFPNSICITKGERRQSNNKLLVLV